MAGKSGKGCCQQNLAENSLEMTTSTVPLKRLNMTFLLFHRGILFGECFFASDRVKATFWYDSKKEEAQPMALKWNVLPKLRTPSSCLMSIALSVIVPNKSTITTGDFRLDYCGTDSRVKPRQRSGSFRIVADERKKPWLGRGGSATPVIVLPYVSPVSTTKC